MQNHKVRKVRRNDAQDIASPTEFDEHSPAVMHSQTPAVLPALEESERWTGLPSGIETISSLDRLMEFREEWNALAERFSTPLLSHEWFSSCAATLCPPGRLNVLVLRTDGRTRAIAPLVRFRRFGIEQLELLGTAYLMEPTSFLFNDSSSFEELFDAILDLKMPLLLKRLLTEPEVRLIAEASRKKSFLVMERSNSSQWISINSSWNEYQAQMKSSRRSNLRRLRRLLQKEGRVEVQVHTGESGDFDRALDEAFRIEASGWKAQKGTAILANKKLKEFFTTYASEAARSGIVRLFILRVNGRGIAMLLGVEYSRRLWILKVGYDESWARFAPGIFLHHESVRWAFERRLEGYEFLGTTEPWIRSWTESTHTYRTFRLFPGSLKGLMALCMEGVSVLLKKASDVGARISMALRSP